MGMMGDDGIMKRYEKPQVIGRVRILELWILARSC